ncbi:sugar ABC transporter ATP-binding protein [Rhodoligotrophos ferricapiens]|uniref:sugar ABC transporter ATP-binding protein n=1 Tax=Rhodoligotrophos ferricapiens TaxID=3069264 RepID=UPI00315CB568
MTAVASRMREGEELISLSHASKFYGSFAALKDVSLALRRGEVHMLLGENGAGKSTLVSLLTGVNRLDEGERKLNGVPAPYMTPAEARASGINAVLQDFSLAPAMTVEENYGLGREPVRGGLVDRKRLRAETMDALAKLNLHFRPTARVDSLARAEQQLLEIARALGGRPGALILDEPTASLSHDESERLFEIVRQLRDEGWAILYISHRMEEIRRLGDVVTILRDGRMAGHYRLAEVSNDRLIADMVGREMAHFYPDIPHKPGPVKLETQSLSSGESVKAVSIKVHAGEIVGLGGLVGCGKSELARAIFGLRPLTQGKIQLDGQEVRDPAPARMLEKGLIYLPQDRRGEALALDRSVAENMTVEVLTEPQYARSGFIRRRSLSGLVANLLQALNVAPPDPTKKVAQFSGGNQQKVVLGRALSRPRKVYVFEEPTAGIDVGARLDFYRQLERLCSEGAAILLITSDLQELVHLAHRAYVMHAGELVAELPKSGLREEAVVAYAFGEKPQSAPEDLYPGASAASQRGVSR